MLDTAMAHHFITETFRSGIASYSAAAIARELVDFYRADITGETALAAAVELDAHGITATQVRRNVRAGGVTYDFVAAAVKAVRVASTEPTD
ncbi:DUF7185 family protein [Mycolicibacterium llatzerense]|uniref:DUF7185 family protein n=1 Tax=Mycolicibacterium llatzerense TaxID=280871 RepID=UPI0021B5FD7A|nr:hypothetical protein [Mycolicibacterium llatzerense]MCT7373378.1 hypothetical protein [Mycolicibacterium llatzerense]